MSNSISYLVYIPHGNGIVEYNDTISYAIVSKNDISMIVCDTEHVGNLLLKRCGCLSCGGERKCFRLASMDEILEWSKV